MPKEFGEAYYELVDNMNKVFDEEISRLTKLTMIKDVARIATYSRNVVEKMQGIFKELSK